MEVRVPMFVMWMVIGVLDIGRYTDRPLASRLDVEYFLVVCMSWIIDIWTILVSPRQFNFQCIGLGVGKIPQYIHMSSTASATHRFRQSHSILGL